MKKARFSEEQMVTILREADQRPVPEVAKKHGVSDQTIYGWRKRFGTLEPADVKRLRQLEQENGRLKKMVADRELEIDVLKEITRKKWDPHDRRSQIVIRDTRRHAVEVRKGADVPIEKADLILALVNPREVAARVHQPHQEQPRLAAGAIDVDQHLEEVDLGEIARPIRQRHEDLAALPLPFCDRLFDDGHADALALSPQQLVESRGGQPLLAPSPPHRFGEQHLHAVGDRIPDRPGPSRGLRLPTGDRLIHVFPNRDTRQPQFAGDRPLGPPLNQHLMSNHMHEIHPEHPPANPGSSDPASPPSSPQVVYFPSGVWSTF